MRKGWTKEDADEYKFHDGDYVATVRFSGFMWHWHPYGPDRNGSQIMVGGGGCSRRGDAMKYAEQDICRHKAKH
jgi:hypothetical protein